MPENWGVHFQQYLVENDCSIASLEFVYSYEGTLDAISKNDDFCGVIMISDWAMDDADKNRKGVFALLKDKIPTLTIITNDTFKNSGYKYMDEVYFRPMHDFVTAPFDAGSLENWMLRMCSVNKKN